MAGEQDKEAPGGRLVLLIAVAAVCAVAAVAFGRVYQGAGTAGKFVLAAVVCVALAAALERRHILLAALASAAALILMATWLVLPSTAWFGLPTDATFRAAWAAIRIAQRTSNLQVAPAPPLPPLVLTGMIAVWAASFASHSMAVRARSPLLALMPPAALMAFAGIVMDDGSRPAYIVAFLVASFGVLFADSLRRVGGWGPVTVWHGRGRLRLVWTSSARGAGRVAIIALVVAAFFPWILPGFQSRGLLAVDRSSGQSVSIDPIVDIRPRLLQNPAVTLFTVRTTQPSYWQFLSLDIFDGREWRPSNPGASNGFGVSNGPLPDAVQGIPCLGDPKGPGGDPFGEPGISKGGGSRATCGPGGPPLSLISSQFTFGRLSQPWLPVAFDPISLSLPRGAASYDPVGNSIVYPDGTYPGFSYSSTSAAVAPSPAELRAVGNLAGPGTDRYLQLPRSLSPAIHRIALEWTAGQTSPYGKIMAIQQHLLGFTYDLKAVAPSGANDLLYFLTRSHRGYCQQFAGSMAVLLRSIGIPARVAVGFTPGTYEPSQGVWRVTTQNAHAWVEVPFPRYGWLQFNPTPTLPTNPQSVAYDVPPAGGSGSLAGCTRIIKNRCVGGVTGGSGRQLRLSHNPYLVKLRHDPTAPTRGIHPLADTTSGSFDRGLAVAIGLIVLGLAALLIPLAKFGRRRLRLARARAPRARTLAAFDVLQARAADLGFGRRAHETFREYGDRLGAAPAVADAEVERLTGLATRAAYAADEPSREEAETALRASQGIARSLRGLTTPWRRLAGWYRLAPDRLAPDRG